MEIQIQNFLLLKTVSRPLFDEDSIALVSAGSLALVFELRCIDSKFLKNRKKCHARDASSRGDLNFKLRKLRKLVYYTCSVVCSYGHSSWLC